MFGTSKAMFGTSKALRGSCIQWQSSWRPASHALQRHQTPFNAIQRPRRTLLTPTSANLRRHSRAMHRPPPLPSGRPRRWPLGCVRARRTHVCRVHAATILNDDRVGDLLRVVVDKPAARGGTRARALARRARGTGHTRRQVLVVVTWARLTRAQASWEGADAECMQSGGGDASVSRGANAEQRRQGGSGGVAGDPSALQSPPTRRRRPSSAIMCHQGAIGSHQVPSGCHPMAQPASRQPAASQPRARGRSRALGVPCEAM